MSRHIKKTGYTYDESGNRLTKTTGSGALTYTYNDDNRLADVEGDAGGMAYLYDEAGAVVMKVTNDKYIGYTYDTAGRLIRWADGATTVTFGYDGDGNRVWKSVNGVKTRYVNDINSSVPQVLVETTDNYGVVAKYFYANGERLMQVRGNTVSYYVYDMPGRSVVAMTDTSGVVQNSYTYDSFGNIVMQSETVTNDFKYDGEQYDKETGLIYLRYRYYDPEIGRFTSKDPFPGYITDPATINPYPFVKNNPLINVDPLGLVTYSIGIYSTGGFYAAGGYSGISFNVGKDSNTGKLSFSITGNTAAGGTSGKYGGLLLSFTATNADSTTQLNGTGVELDRQIPATPVSVYGVTGNGYSGIGASYLYGSPPLDYTPAASGFLTITNPVLEVVESGKTTILGIDVTDKSPMTDAECANISGIW